MTIEFPPPDATGVEGFALHVAWMPNKDGLVGMTVADKENPPTLAALRCGCEFLMSIVAKQSNAGFEAALDDLVAGAIRCRTVGEPPEELKPKDLRDFHFVVQRDGESTFCIVRAQTKDQIESEGQLLEAIQRAVTDWIDNTEEGKAAFRERGWGLNVGDLASYLGDDYLKAALKDRGVEYLKMETQFGTELEGCWDFDTYLYGVGGFPDED